MTVRAWLELTRISNAPTVITNVIVGAAAGVYAVGNTTLIPAAVGVAVGSGLAFYLAGMALNDVFDAARDAQERPQRPIPSGRIRRWQATAFSIVALAGGLGLLFAQPSGIPAGIALAGTIVLYDAWHHRDPDLAVPLMGLCRGLLVLMAAWTMSRVIVVEVNLGSEIVPVVIVFGVATAYTMLVTRLAQGETGAGLTPSMLMHGLPLIALVPFAMLIWVPTPPAELLGVAAAAWLCFVAWHRRNRRYAAKRPPVAIMGWLAGFCLIDTTSLAILGYVGLAAAAAACFGLTVLAHRRILGS